MTGARTYEPDELQVGLRAEFEREVREEDILTFARLTGDENPLHVDAEYAASTTFERRLAHGAFQVGLASAMVGMHLPGVRVLLGSVHARFPAPLFFPTRVVVSGEIASWNRDSLAGTVKVVVRDVARQLPTAEIVMGFTLHGRGGEGKAERAAAVACHLPNDRPVVIVTGASGGLGAAVVERLAGQYALLALVGRNPLPAKLRDRPDVHELAIDLAVGNAIEQLERVLEDARAPLFGVVHAAWPGVPRGGLLGLEDTTIEEQIRFGTVYPLRLARLLFRRVPPGGGRLVMVGSTYGTRRPNVTMAAYSLGKAALESTVRLLALEMGRKGVTVNGIAPGPVPAGMNKHQNERWYRMQSALVPLGRLCRPEDVADVVQFLLSAGAEFVSGEVIELAGGQV